MLEWRSFADVFVYRPINTLVSLLLFFQLVQQTDRSAYCSSCLDSGSCTTFPFKFCATTMTMKCEAVSSDTMDECLPLHYRKFCEDLPEQQQLLTPQDQNNNRKVKDIFVSPTGTVSTTASSVSSALTPPFAGGEMFSSRGTPTGIDAPPVPFPRETTALKAARRVSLRAKMLRRESSGMFYIL